VYDTLDDFRQRYESLSDEALLEESRDELVELARQCLNAELARRNLTPPVAEVPPVENPEPDEELVPVATFASLDEAEAAWGLLDSAGIPCSLPKHHSGYNFKGGGPLLVPVGMLDQAREMLAAPVPEEEVVAAAEAAVNHTGVEAENV
jgi:hypothetical protein